MVTELKRTLGEIRSEIKSAQALASFPDSTNEPFLGEKELDNSSRDTNISAKEASEICHDEPVTIGTVLRSLLMANEPAQRECRKTF